MVSSGSPSSISVSEVSLQTSRAQIQQVLAFHIYILILRGEKKGPPSFIESQYIVKHDYSLHCLRTEAREGTNHGYHTVRFLPN